MKTYEISNQASGVLLATIEANSEADAWALLCADIAYDGEPGDDIIIEAVPQS